MLAPSGDAYVLRVRGDSMIDAHIADGDFVVIRPQSTARNGDIVVAQVEENAVTLKRFFKEAGRVRLQPANREYAADVLRRRAHPGQADRGHPPPRLGRQPAIASGETPGGSPGRTVHRLVHIPSTCGQDWWTARQHQARLVDRSEAPGGDHRAFLANRPVTAKLSRPLRNLGVP